MNFILLTTLVLAGLAVAGLVRVLRRDPAQHVPRSDLDDFDPRPEQIAALRAEQQAIRAKLSARINELQQQINNLLALEAA